MNKVKETVAECEKCGEVFIVAADDTSLFKTLFGHEIECPECGAWCDFELGPDMTFQRDD